MFKKKLLAATIVAASVPAFAGVDLDAGTGTINYSSESTVAAATSIDTNVGAVTTVNSGFSISDSTARYMRFDLTGGEFGAAPTLAVTDSGGVGGANEVLSSGGAAGDTYVVFEVTASATNTVGITDDAVLSVATIDVDDQTGVAVQYRLYDNASDAVNAGASTLASASGQLLSFVDATNVDVVDVTPAQIDVTNGSTIFVGSTQTTVIGSVDLTDTAGSQFVVTDDTADTTIASSRSAGTLTVTGDFTAAQDLTAGVPDGTYTVSNVFLDADADQTCDNPTNATSVDDTEAVFALGNAAADWDVCITTNGVSLIPEVSYTGLYEPTASAGFTLANTSLTLETLEKNGSSVDLSMLLTPSGAFQNFVRITNPSNIDGDVFITLYNDAGDSVQINLGDIAGVASNQLDANNSTALLNINDIYAAAQAADATFAVGSGADKLRAVVEGEFSGITAQNLSLATDNTYFGTF